MPVPHAGEGLVLAEGRLPFVFWFFFGFFFWFGGKTFLFCSCVSANTQLTFTKTQHTRVSEQGAQLLK